MSTRKILAKYLSKKYADKILSITNDSNDIYQVIGWSLSGISDRECLDRVSQQRIGWNNPCYDQIQAKLEEHDAYVVKPFDISEGLVDCQKCGSKKTWSVQKQLRSADEPMTTFTNCMDCGYSWGCSN